MNIGLRKTFTGSLTLAFLAAVLSSPVEATPGGHPFSVEAQAIKDKGYKLKVTLQNCSDTTFKVPIANLPWGQNRLGLVLYSAGKVAGEPLPQSIKIADFPFTQIEIKPHASISGVVNLDSEFPALARYASKQDIVAFWVYDTSLLDGGLTEYVGGMVLLDPEHGVDSAGTGCH